MEPQVEVCCKKTRRIRCCIDLVIFIVSIIIAFVAGLLIGALTGLVAVYLYR